LFDNVLASSLLRGAPARHFYRQVSGFDNAGINLWLAFVGAVAIAVIVLAIRFSERWSWRGAAIVATIVSAAVAVAAGGVFFRGWAIAQLILLPFAIRRPREPLLLLLVISLCASSRVFLRMSPEWYGFVFLVPVYVLIAYVLLEWLPERGVYSRQAARIAIVPLVVLAAQFVWTENRLLSQKTFPVHSDRGVFHDANGGRAAILDAFIERVRILRPRSLVVVPEGLTLNYLTRTKTPISFHTFTPVEAADPEIEARIIADLTARPPEYIAVVSRDVSDFGYRGFGLDYDRRLAAVISQHYTVYERWRLPSFELILLRAR
jgi:hypothetical protein